MTPILYEAKFKFYTVPQKLSMLQKLYM